MRRASSDGRRKAPRASVRLRATIPFCMRCWARLVRQVAYAMEDAPLACRTPSSQASSRSWQRRRSTYQSSRVQGKECDAELLQEVGPIVVAMEVLHLVQDDLTQVFSGEGLSGRPAGSRMRGCRKPATLGIWTWVLRRKAGRVRGRRDGDG